MTHRGLHWQRFLAWKHEGPVWSLSGSLKYARLILLSPLPGAVCERSISSCCVGATARGRAPGMESPLLSLPVRDVSRRRRPPRRRGDGTRPGARDGVPPPLAPSQGCEQETRSAEMTGRRHEAGRQGWSLPSSRSQSGMRAGDDVRQDDGTRPAPECVSPPPPLASSQGCEQGTKMAVPRRYDGDEQTRSTLGWAGSPVNSFPRIELGAPP